MPLTVTSQEKMPGVYVLYPVGSLDTNTFEVMEKEVDSIIKERQAKVITFDMAGVHFISSMGIRTIVKTKKQLDHRGGQLIVVNPQPQVSKVFEIINALPSLRIFSNVEELDNYLAEMQRQVIEGKD